MQQKGFWHSCIVHPMVTIWPRIGCLLHTFDEFHPEDPLARLQWAAITIDDDEVQRVLQYLADLEPFGAYLKHRRTLVGAIHNLIGHPLMWAAPALGYKIHEWATTPNPFAELVKVIRNRVDQKDNATFDRLCDEAERELRIKPRD